MILQEEKTINEQWASDVPLAMPYAVKSGFHLNGVLQRLHALHRPPHDDGNRRQRRNDQEEEEQPEEAVQQDAAIDDDEDLISKNN
jgi:hypothetical protein